MTCVVTGASPTFIAFAPVFYSLLCFSPKVTTNTRSVCITRSSAFCSCTSPYCEGRRTLVYCNFSKSFCTVFIVIWCILVIIMNRNYAAIKGKLYPHSMVVDSFRDDLWLMYENIDTCWGIFTINFCPCYLEDK